MPRISQSFSEGEVNVLAAMAEAAQTGTFENPESTETFQHTARKVIGMRKKVQAMPSTD